MGISLYLSWEVDEDCKAVLRFRHPEALDRGDFLEDDPDKVISVIREHDPFGHLIVLFCGGPPCPDFSSIRENAPGSAGPEGQKFTAYCDFVEKIESGITNKRVGHLCENVVMEKGEADFFSGKLSCNPVVNDAADLQLINRPRLWWTRVDWSKLRLSPHTGSQLKWSKHNKYHRVLNDGEPQRIQDMQLHGHSFDPLVCRGEKRIPCFTTPAPDESGRPAPKKMRGNLDPEQKSRWMNDQRHFAPWQYANEAMMIGTDGSRSVPSADVKDQCHMFTEGYTGVHPVTERSRHRMIANSWHLGSARFMMMLVLQAVVTLPTASPVPAPRVSSLQFMAQFCSSYEPQIGPGSWTNNPNCVPQAESMWQHWHLALHAAHPLQRPPEVEPGLRQCIEIHHRLGDLARLRTEVVQEVAQMADDQMEATWRWWKALPRRVAQVYYDPQHDEIAQIPLFLQLLGMFGMPGLHDLGQDLNHGFAVLGTLHPEPTRSMSFPSLLRHSRPTTTTTP